MAEEFESVNLRKANKQWLEKERDRIARQTDYPRKVSLDEAFTALRAFKEQREHLNKEQPNVETH